jgi:outer membrane protein assembly factor BamB
LIRNLYAIDKATGRQVWKASIAGASGVPGDKARATPVVADGKVIVGTQGPFGGGGKLLAFDKGLRVQQQLRLRNAEQQAVRVRAPVGDLISGSGT